MARVRKTEPTFESIFFNTPEQRVVRLLLSEPTTIFTPRVISSKLKGVRGLGGAEGLMRILGELELLGMVDFVDNHRAVRLRDDSSSIHILKTFSAICDLESLRKLLEPVSTKGILFGSRSDGRARSDSDYDLFVVSDQSDEVQKVASHHPLAKSLELVVWSSEKFRQINKTNPPLDEKLRNGVVLWGSTW